MEQYFLFAGSVLLVIFIVILVKLILDGFKDLKEMGEDKLIIFENILEEEGGKNKDVEEIIEELEEE